MRAKILPLQALAFARAGRQYLMQVHPAFRREFDEWQTRAIAIPDPLLRDAALATQVLKAGHSEGAAAFAVLVPQAQRDQHVKMLVAFELLADYLDTISEFPAEDDLANNLLLHRSMSAALGLEPELDDYYRLHPCDDDGGYMRAHISICRELATKLPSYGAIEGALRRLVTCYAESQTLHHTGGRLEDARRFEQTSLEIDRHQELHWRETVVAGSSTLAMLALLSAAVKPGLTPESVDAIVSLYYPMASALHIMLDSVIDLQKDRATGDINQVDNYESWQEASQRLAFLASRSRVLARQTPDDSLHEVILAGMAGYYLSHPEAWEETTARTSRDILDELGPMATWAVRVHRVKRDPRAVLRGERRPGSRSRLREPA